MMLASVVAYALDYHVTGVVTDSISQPELYATVRVYSTTDSVKPVSLGTTDDSGAFNLKLDRSGDYRLSVSSVGKSPLDRNFTVSDSSPVADLGTMVIHDNSTILAEVSVTAQRPLVTKEIDRIGYDVQADEDAKTSNIQEILSKVPLVTVESDGTIKVRGESDFKIYKNGRPNNTYTKNAKELFKSIPASSIKRIEVITEPGAREDAEGIGAILNIVTLDNVSFKGVTGSVSLHAQSNNDFIPAPNVNLTTQIDKVTLSVYGGFYYSGHRSNRSNSESESTYHDSGNRLISKSKTIADLSSDKSGYFGAEGSWEIDTLNLISLDMNGWMSQSDWAQEGNTVMLAPDGSTIYSFRNTSLSPVIRYLNFDGSLNYQHSTRHKGETLTLSYRLSTTDQHEESETQYYDMVNPLFAYTGITSDSRMDFTEHTGQFDWTRPINDQHKFDLGVKFIHRNNHSKEDRQYIGVNDDKTNFTHRTTIAAAYFDYRLKISKWSLRAGARYEFSHLSAKFRTGEYEDFGSNLNDVVPNAAISYKINDSHSLKASYSSRISRPYIDYLNPAVTETPTSTSSGNPNLNSSLYNSLSLNYSLIASKITVDLSANYNFNNNGIARQQHVIDDHVYSTYENCAHQRTLGFFGYIQWSITPKTSFMFNGGLNYKYIEDPSAGLSLSRWGGHLYSRITQTLPWKLKLEGYIQFYSMTPYSVYSYSKTTSSNLYHGFTLRRNFLKDDRLTVRATITNPFSSDIYRFNSLTINGGYTGSSDSYHYGRKCLSLSVSYRFGSLNAYVKKTNAAINNDDLDGNDKKQK